MIVCILFHDWWHSSHRVEMRDSGMSQTLFCRIYRCWRYR